MVESSDIQATLHYVIARDQLSKELDRGLINKSLKTTSSISHDAHFIHIYRSPLLQTCLHNWPTECHEILVKRSGVIICIFQEERHSMRKVKRLGSTRIQNVVLRVWVLLK